MGTQLPFSAVGLGVLMAIFGAVSQVNTTLVCNFGPNNIPDLVLRNNTYTNYTNTFLYNYAYTARDELLRASTFDLVKYLKGVLGWDLTNQSHNVSYGALLQINWTAVAQSYRMNVSYIQANYLDIVHTEMQFYADFFVMSYGIYRPKAIRFYYSGIDTALSGDKLVPESCLAGYRIFLRIPTNATYLTTLSYPNNTDYATFATMIETSFDQFFRRPLSAFANDFVRVNLFRVYTSSLYQVAADIEVYFLTTNNATYVRDYIVENINLLPPLTFLKYPVSVITSGILVSTVLAGPATLTTPSTTEIITSTSTMTALVTSTILFTNSSTASTAAMTNTTFVSSPTTQGMQNTTQAGLTTTSTATTSSTLNTTLLNSTQTSRNATTINISTTTARLNESSTTTSPIVVTFDADPLFLPVAPVFPKKYNDPVMVPRVIQSETMTPYQMKDAILKITLPVAAGIIGFVVGLLLCLQSDWLPKPAKATLP